MKPAFSVLVLLCLLSACRQKDVQPTVEQDFAYQTGDLVFQDADCGDFCIAIEKVTQSYRGARLSHVGIVDQLDNGQFVVLEAVSKGVVETPLDSFLQGTLDAKGQPKVIVGRLKAQYQQYIPKAIEHARTLLGKPYDDVFDIQNDAYYCSELLYESFKKASADSSFFELKPMTFKDPDTKETFAIWAKYYQDLGVDIPEGQPGLNPGGISRSAKIDIVKIYYSIP